MTAAEKLRARMTQTKGGWTAADLERLYTGHGFTYREGKKHRIYAHPRYPTLRATVARTQSLPTGYIQTALDLLGRLDWLEATTEEER